MLGVSIEELEKNSSLIHAKLEQISLKLEWLAYLRDNDDQSLRETWDLKIRETQETRNAMLAKVGYLISGAEPVPEDKTFPAFPFDDNVIREMHELAKNLSRMYGLFPDFVTLILTLKTREKFVAFYKEEYERSQNNKGEPDYEHYRKLTHQFIEQLADRLYAK